jgi:hypothetical protein
VVGHLEIEIDDLEWIVSRMKAELTEHLSVATGLEQIVLLSFKLACCLLLFLVCFSLLVSK